LNTVNATMAGPLLPGPQSEPLAGCEGKCGSRIFAWPGQVEVLHPLTLPTGEPWRRLHACGARAPAWGARRIRSPRGTGCGNAPRWNRRGGLRRARSFAQAGSNVGGGNLVDPAVKLEGVGIVDLPGFHIAQRRGQAMILVQGTVRIVGTGGIDDLGCGSTKEGTRFPDTYWLVPEWPPPRPSPSPDDPAPCENRVRPVPWPAASAPRSKTMPNSASARPIGVGGSGSRSSRGSSFWSRAILGAVWNRPALSV